MTDDERQRNLAEANHQALQEFLRQCYLFGTACLKTTVTPEGLVLENIENFDHRDYKECP